MKKLSDYLDVVSQSRNRWQELERRANTACRSMDEECKNIANEIITYWMNNGGLADKCFKYNKRFSDWGRYTCGDNDDYAYCHILKPLSITNVGALCIMERFSAEFRNYDDSLVLGRYYIEIPHIHPDCAISKEEYENEKKSFVDGVLNTTVDKDNRPFTSPKISAANEYDGE